MGKTKYLIEKKFYLDRETLQRLEQLRRITGASMSSIVRNAIKQLYSTYIMMLGVEHEDKN